MVWNTIAHPRMMNGASDNGLTRTPYPIKFADSRKMAFFDLIIDMSDNSKLPVLVHGDHETIKNKILNHEMVIAAVINNVIESRGTTTRVKIMPMQIVSIEYINKDDKYIILVDSDLILTPDNTIEIIDEGTL